MEKVYHGPQIHCTINRKQLESPIYFLKQFVLKINGSTHSNENEFYFRFWLENKLKDHIDTTIAANTGIFITNNQFV